MGGIIELLILILVLAWLFGYFGRGRWYGRGSGPVLTTPRIDTNNWVHILLVIVLILVLLRLLGVD